MESALELRKKVAESLREDREKEARDALRESVMKELIGLHKFEVPSGMVASQLEYLMRDNAQFLKSRGFTEKMTRDYFEKNKDALAKRAEEQVRLALILDRISETQGIKVERADLDHEYTKVSGRLNLPLDQVKALYERDESALRQLRHRLKEDKAIDYVLGQVKIS
jgi:trigger factor